MTLVCGNFDWNYAELFYYFLGEFTPLHSWFVLFLHVMQII